MGAAGARPADRRAHHGRGAAAAAGLGSPSTGTSSSQARDWWLGLACLARGRLADLFAGARVGRAASGRSAARPTARGPASVAACSAFLGLTGVGSVDGRCPDLGFARTACARASRG